MTADFSVIDLSSDTATQPSEAMREAMASAPVGDEQKGDDPTVNALQEEAAALLGKETALFLPSATMANQIALKIHTQPGGEIICHENAHIRLYEGGGPAIFSGCLLHTLAGSEGRFTGAQVEAAIRPDDPHFAVTQLICIENTQNFAGGTLWTPVQINEVADVCDSHNLALHLDGSRLMNAAVALNLPAAILAARFDTVTLCLSKGLGAPVGAILAGSRVQMTEARRWKHRMGGAMRQAGIIAAGGLFALRHNIPQLATDHSNAQLLAKGIALIPGVRLDPPPQTNIVYFDVTETGFSGADAKARLESVGVRASHPGNNRLRFVTHLDVSTSHIREAIARTRQALTESV